MTKSLCESCTNLAYLDGVDCVYCVKRAATSKFGVGGFRDKSKGTPDVKRCKSYQHGRHFSRGLDAIAD